MRRLGSGLTAVALLAAAHAAPAHAYTALYALGDSLSDVGNVYLGTGQPAAPYATGRFSNGANYIDDLSAALGLPAPVPALAGGNDYAFGGARANVDPGFPGALPVPTVVEQALAFSAVQHPNAGSALFSVWIGANDVFGALAAVAGGLSLSAAETELITSVGSELAAIGILQADGAKHFVIPNVPDLGVTPSYNKSALKSDATTLSAFYDAALAKGLATITGATIATVDTFSAIEALVADPPPGFTNVTDPCFVSPSGPGVYADPNWKTDGSTCALTLAGQNTHLFWDNVHPTAAGYAIIAADAANAVPEPAGLAALGVGVLGLAILRRRSAAAS